MRFQRLHIPAFGPFTDLELEFPSQDHDFHVFYGENEAGKSSLLRAIRDLLFGIHGQSPDNFLHEYKILRLRGEIVNRSGRRLVFQRRKGNRNTLLDKDGNPLPDTALQPFLGSVDLSYFSAMFGLGNSELRDGARQLLRGEGEVGNALFSASLGGTPIQRVMDALVEESEELFKGRATTNVTIRPAANQYKTLLKQSREAMVNPEKWEKLENEMEEQEAAKQRLDDDISELERKLGWIARCEDALPNVGRLTEEVRLLEELPELPELASDFVSRAQSARNQAKESRASVQGLATQITQLESQLKECSTSPEFLAEAEALDVLHQHLGAYRDRKEELTNLESKLAGTESALRAGMKGLELNAGLESLETLRLGSAARMRCEEAAKDLQDARDKRDGKRREADQLMREIESVEDELKSLPETDMTPLREALSVAAEAAEANKTLALSEAEVENLRGKAADEHALVIGAPKDPDATSCLSVPGTSTIRKFRERFDSIERDIKAEEDKIREEGKRAGAFQDELGRLERRGELPSEEALEKARSHRDHGWRLVLAEWKGDGAKEELISGSPLEKAFPEAILKADGIADQLRQQADAVAQAEEKRSQIVGSETRITKAKENLAGLHRTQKECQDSWAAEWAASRIELRSPGEMEEWRETWVQFRETRGLLRIAEAAVRTKTGRIQQARETIAAVLGDSQDKDFPLLFEAAKSRLEEGEPLTVRRSLIAERLQEHRTRSKTAEKKSEALIKAVDTAGANWISQCQALGLPDDVSPDSGLRLLQERKELLAKFDHWKERSGESQKMAEANHEYEQSVREKAAKLGIPGDTTEVQEAGLWEALTRSRKAQVAHDQLAGQIRKAEQELTEAKQAESQALEALHELMRLAKLTTVEELEPLLANLEKRSTIQSRIDNFREMLSGPARGQSVDEFKGRVLAENADDLPGRRVELERGKTEKKATLQEFNDTLAGLKKQKQEMEEAGDAAANFRQQAESVAAALKQDASRFTRLRLAAHFLRTQIERFREENQGPLLEKSGQVFKHITQGAFDGLGAEFNNQDIPVLVGRRSGGSNVPVEGLSDGSRDQLYLALRLAALDRYLEDHEPMPLILDDLLITFDDERVKAILPQLADVATRTQIFLFTHHEHLVDLCRRTLEEDQFVLHRLDTLARAGAS